MHSGQFLAVIQERFSIEAELLIAANLSKTGCERVAVQSGKVVASLNPAAEVGFGHLIRHSVELSRTKSRRWIRLSNS